MLVASTSPSLRRHRPRAQFARGTDPYWQHAYDFSTPGWGHKDLCGKLDLTITGAPTMTSPGPGGGCYITDGTSGVAVSSKFLSGTLSPALTTAPAYIGAVFSFDALPSGQSGIIGIGSHSNAANDHLFAMELSNAGVLSFRIRGNSADTTVTGPTLTAGKVYSVIMYQAAQNVFVWYANDGTNVSAASLAANGGWGSFGTADLFVIGAHRRNSGLTFTGGALLRFYFAAFGSAGRKYGDEVPKRWAANPWRQFPMPPKYSSK